MSALRESRVRIALVAFALVVLVVVVVELGERQRYAALTPAEREATGEAVIQDIVSQAAAGIGPSDRCLEGFERAVKARADNPFADSWSDFDFAVGQCLSVADWTAAANATGALDGDPAEILYYRCQDNTVPVHGPACKEVRAP